jgi:hypothetical protein
VADAGNSWRKPDGYNTRFGLSNGARGQIVSLATDWLNPHITVEVLI